MEFALSEEQEAIFDLAYSFGQENIAPFSIDWEKQGTIPKELWAKTSELGFGGIYVSEEYGGSGLSRLDATLIFEALAMACPSVGSFLSIHNMVGGMIDKFGSTENKDLFLPDLCSMKKIYSYCLTEPGSGSDASALKTKGIRTNEGYILNGTKSFISGGAYSDAYLTMTRTGGEGPSGISAIIIEDPSEGLSFGAFEEKMGWRAQPTAQVQFDDCRVPGKNLIGEEWFLNTKIVDTEWMDQMAAFVKPETTHHISFIAHSMMTPDIDSLFREIWHSSSTTNGWSATEWLKDPAVDALLDQGRAELDPSKRATLYAAAEQKILDSSPDIFLAAPNGVYASSDLVVWPFQNPEVITGYIWADFDFRLTATDAMKD